jgi:hypothetical protein
VTAPTPNLRPQRMVGETVIDAVLALEIAAESLSQKDRQHG